MRVLCSFIAFFVSQLVFSQNNNSTGSIANQIIIEIIVEEPFCSLCLLQLNDALSSKDFENYTFLLRYETTDLNSFSIVKIRMQEYLKDINFDFIVKQNSTEIRKGPFLIIRNMANEEIITYDEIFDSFNKKRLIKRIKRDVKKITLPQK